MTEKRYSMLEPDGFELRQEDGRKRTAWQEHLDEETRKAVSTAPRKRELAWQMLKDGAPPEYVALRYGYPAETMREARAKIDSERTNETTAKRERRRILAPKETK